MTTRHTFKCLFTIYLSLLGCLYACAPVNNHAGIHNNIKPQERNASQMGGEDLNKATPTYPHKQKEYKSEQSGKRYSNLATKTQETIKDSENVKSSIHVDNIPETTIIERTITLPYSIAHGITKVKGNINGYIVYFSYIANQKISISAYQAEYFLSNGYISKSDCSGKIGADNKIPVGSTIRFSSVTIGGESFSNIKAVVVDNDQLPLVFGDKIFGNTSKVTKDRNRSVIEITQIIQLN